MQQNQRAQGGRLRWCAPGSASAWHNGRSPGGIPQTTVRTGAGERAGGRVHGCAGSEEQRGDTPERRLPGLQSQQAAAVLDVEGISVADWRRKALDPAANVILRLPNVRTLGYQIADAAHNWRLKVLEGRSSGLRQEAGEHRRRGHRQGATRARRHGEATSRRAHGMLLHAAAP